MNDPRPESLIAIDREMARQHADALASFTANREVAARAAASLKKTGRLLMLGMGGSHAVARAVEPYYRALGIDAVSLPVSEQLAAPLPLAPNSHKPSAPTSTSSRYADVAESDPRNPSRSPPKSATAGCSSDSTRNSTKRAAPAKRPGVLSHASRSSSDSQNSATSQTS